MEIQSPQNVSTFYLSETEKLHKTLLRLGKALERGTLPSALV